jgi:hypothetical protein
LISRAYDAAIKAICNADEIKALAAQLGVTPGIVAGRYRHLTGNWQYYHRLIRNFKWRPA